MILTCPNCATRYSTKSDDISANGRTVRCAACETTWFVSAEAAMAENAGSAAKTSAAKTKGPTKTKSVDPDALALADNQIDVMEDMHRAAPAAQNLSPKAAAMSASGGAAIAVSKGAHVSMRDKADAQKLGRRHRMIFWIWAVPIGILSLAALVGFVFRQDIVDATPKTASFYKKLGFQVKQNGLLIEPPIVETALIEGQTVLVINSAVKNLSSDTQDLPFIELTLHNGADEELVQWNVELERAKLGGKGRLEFASQFPDPPVDTVKLTYRFAR